MKLQYITKLVYYCFWGFLMSFIRRPKVIALLVIGSAGAYYYFSHKSPSSETAEQKVSEEDTRSIASTPSPHISATVHSANLSEEEHQRAIAALENSLQSEGWQESTGTPPDIDVLGLNPRLLGTDREAELQLQIHTNSFEGEDLEKLAHIARSAQDAKTRAIAIEALGRSTDPNASEMLIGLYNAFPESENRVRVLTQVSASDLNDSSTTFLKTVVNSENASADEKSIAVGTLTITALAKSNTLPDSLLSELPPEFHAQMNTLANSLVQGGPAITHGH